MKPRDLQPSVSVISAPQLRQFAKSSASLSIVDQCLASATNFLTGMLIARAAGVEEFGLYFLGFTTVWIVLELQSALVTTPYLVFAPRLSGSEATRYAGSIRTHQLGLSVVGAALAGFGALLASIATGWLPDGVGAVFLALIVALPCLMLRDFARRVCFARKRMATALLIDGGVFMIQILGLAVLASNETLNATSAYCVIAVATLLPAVAWLYSERASFSPGPWRDDLRRNLQLGGWVFASGLLWAVSSNIYPWLVAGTKGSAAAGIWGACMQLLAIANIPMLGTQNFLGPKLATLYAEEGVASLRRLALRSSALFGAAVFFVATVLWLFADLILRLVYGEEFQGNADVVLLLVLNLATVAAAFPLSRGLFALERARADFLVNLVPVTLLFAAGIPLIHSHGVVGGAVGLFLSGGAALVVRLLVFAAVSRSQAPHRRADRGAGGDDGSDDGPT
ncbi:MAG: hypothetical protein AAF581_13845 [Planctomycetota bacterium]